MANFYGTARTNYFKVKDVDAFKEWVSNFPSLTLIENNGLFGFYDSDGFPSSYWDEELDDYADIDLMAEVAEHLTEDSVAIFMEVGAEKVRYLSGWAAAVNHEGVVEYINLDSIYELAEKRFGIKPTLAEY